MRPRALLPAILVLATTLVPAPIAAQDAPAAQPDGPQRPMLAPDGWMFATVLRSADGARPLKVLAISPTGRTELIADLGDVRAGLPERATLDYDLDPRVSVDGVLAVPILLRGEDDLPDSHLIRLIDLQDPDPMATIWDLEVGPEGNQYDSEMAFGPDGRLSVGIGSPNGDVPIVIVVDPLTRERQELIVDDGWERHVWLADGTGWGSTRSDAVFDLSGARIADPVAPSLLDLSGGSEQRSTMGRFLQTYDIGSSGRSVAGEGRPYAIQPYGPSEPCGYDFWARKPGGSFRRGPVVYRDCVDDELLDIRWDVDGEDVLLLQDSRGFVTLTRRQIGGKDRRLARFPVTDLGLGRVPSDRLQVEVHGLARGPRDGELLLAMGPLGRGGEPASLRFYSTVDRRVIEVPAGRRESASFAGFSAPPIDRDVSGLTPFVLDLP